MQNVISDEIRIIRALASVTFPPGSISKRMVRDLNARIDYMPDAKLTVSQRAAILSITVRFRRQIPTEITDLARSLQVTASDDPSDPCLHQRRAD